MAPKKVVFLLVLYTYLTKPSRFFNVIKLLQVRERCFSCYLVSGTCQVLKKTRKKPVKSTLIVVSKDISYRDHETRDFLFNTAAFQWMTSYFNAFFGLHNFSMHINFVQLSHPHCTMQSLCSALNHWRFLAIQ